MKPDNLPIGGFFNMENEQVVYWYATTDHYWNKMDIGAAKGSGIYSNCYLRKASRIISRYHELVTLALF